MFNYNVGVNVGGLLSNTNKFIPNHSFSQGIRWTYSTCKTSSHWIFAQDVSHRTLNFQAWTWNQLSRINFIEKINMGSQQNLSTEFLKVIIAMEHY